MSRQIYNLAYERMRPKQLQLYSMTGPSLTIRNKFDTLQEISETLPLDDEHENFVNAHIKAAAKCIPTNLRAKQSFLGYISS